MGSKMIDAEVRDRNGLKLLFPVRVIEKFVKIPVILEIPVSQITTTFDCYLDMDRGNFARWYIWWDSSCDGMFKR